MDQQDTGTGPGPSPEDRAFTGHPDHPPSTPDHPEDSQQGDDVNPKPQGGQGSPGEATTLPGYGG